METACFSACCDNARNVGDSLARIRKLWNDQFSYRNSTIFSRTETLQGTKRTETPELDVLNHAAECLRTMAHSHRLRMVQGVKSVKASLLKVSCLLRIQAEETAF
jgi:phage gp46-like protein